MIGRAKENFKRFDKEGNITLLEGQASEILPSLNGEYDLIFLDAAKGQYPAFLPECLRLLAPGGIFLADDVLFDGLVAESSRSTRRDMTIVKRLRSFISELTNDETLYSSLIPIGDGMIAVMKKEGK
jgi:predicted O-methyltransferase YrrM